MWQPVGTVNRFNPGDGNMRPGIGVSNVPLAVGWVLLHQGHDHAAESSVPDWAAFAVGLVFFGAVLLASLVLLHSGVRYFYDRLLD